MGRSAGGASVADHLAAVAKKRKRKIALAPSVPTEALHLWNLFTRLNSTRTGNGFGPNPISFLEMESFCRLTGEVLDPWEVHAIRALDDAYLAISNESTKG
ncbi:hypothetical protein UFOVP32_14 [uncultured Caudovirales phage]|uniref:Uncharacterized protein n=1 Tax=uncultured Caudovirales phage TaxID=2100421 RepID=A0A6J5KLR3_9CAUD|nr:hypothetical protein UFOVP32_14 [uncultured Caudovirales phage]CAB4123786.1 hypothetical protein UFOVP50_62 [uncultured Caudovirales phage]